MRKSPNRGGARQLTLPKPPEPEPPAPRAPRKPSYSQEITSYLKEGDVELAVKTLRDGMNALKMVQTGRFRYVEMPDTGMRLTAAKLVLEYAFGKPETRLKFDGMETAAVMADPVEVARKLKGSGLDLDTIIDAYAMTARPVGHSEEEPDERAI